MQSRKSLSHKKNIILFLMQAAISSIVKCKHTYTYGCGQKSMKILYTIVAENNIISASRLRIFGRFCFIMRDTRIHLNIYIVFLMFH